MPTAPAAAPQPSVTRSASDLTRSSLLSLIGGGAASTDALPGAPSAPDRPMRNRSDGIDQTEQEPLQRQNTTTQLNRERVRQNQSDFAGDTILNTTVLMGCLGLVFFGIVIASIVIYITGWTVWSKHRDEQCDQPLQWWLFAMLLIPVVQCQLNHHITEQHKRLQALIMPSLLASGIYMLMKCKTCHHTNPALYEFVKMYLIFQSVLWLAMMCMFFCFVTVIMWAHQRGLLPNQGGGPSNPAKPGTINAIETVAYSPELFDHLGAEGMEPPECSICQDAFNRDKAIKRTPCGHYFHEECLFSWLDKFAKSCPLCRANIEDAIDQQSLPQEP